MVSDDVGALQDAIHATDLRAIPVLVGAILFGVFSLLLVLSTYLLLYASNNAIITLVMLCATWSMYAASASYLILDFASFLSTAHNPEARTDTPLAAVKWQSIVLTALLGITFILSDAIVLWRATIFWRGKFFVKVISIVLFVVIFVFGVADLATDRSNLNPIAGVEATRLIPRAKVDTLGIVSMLTSLIANLWAAGLMAVKAWYFRKVMISTGSMSLLFWKFLRLLLVCSVIYCIFWLTFLGIAVYPTNSDATITLGFAFSNAIVQLTGIYPTIIVVIVNLEYVQTAAQDNIGLQRAGVLASNDSESMQLTRISWRRSSFPQIDDLAAPESSPGPETDAIPDDNKGLASEATTRSRSPSTIHGPTAY